MIQLHMWPTPNAHKVTILLEETGMDYETIPVNISKGEQFAPEFLKISPNNRMPAIVDTDGPNGKSMSLFESGAILIYLADKSGQFLPASGANRYQVLQWLMFQMAGVGPMFGQANHFRAYAPEKVPYAIDRYTTETIRLFGVLNKRLGEAEFLAGDYSIADMATFPWALLYERYDVQLKDFPNLARWLEVLNARPAVQRGLAVMAEQRRVGPMSDEEKAVLFGQKTPS